MPPNGTEEERMKAETGDLKARVWALEELSRQGRSQSSRGGGENWGVTCCSGRGGKRCSQNAETRAVGVSGSLQGRLWPNAIELIRRSPGVSAPRLRRSTSPAFGGRPTRPHKCHTTTRSGRGPTPPTNRRQQPTEVAMHKHAAPEGYEWIFVRWTVHPVTGARV